MENIETKKEEFLSPEDKWAYGINAREKLWKDTIQQAQISAEIKEKLIDAIDKMPMPLISEGGIDSWADYFVRHLLVAIGDMKALKFSKDDTRVLFESLRDDIYSFVADLKK